MSPQLTGITPLIDSCKGLIAQKTLRAHSHLSAAHKRWIDPADLLQEGLLAAFEAQKGYRKGNGAKYSTWLYRKLGWHISHVATALGYQKRATRIVEIDAPIGYEDEVHMDLPDPTSGRQGQQMDVEATFMTLLRSVSHTARVVLIRGFLFHDARLLTPGVATELRRMARWHRIDMASLQAIGQSENIRKKLLTIVAKESSLKPGTEEGLKLLSCINPECKGHFSLGDVREGRFFVATMTCRTCYLALAKREATKSCFGKVKNRDHEGYSVDDSECRLHCADRKVCVQFIQIQGKEGTNVAKEETAVLEGVEDLDKIDEKAEKKAKKKAKAEVAEKPAKKAKAAPVEEEEDEKPAKKEKKEKKPHSLLVAHPELKVLPYRDGSLFLWLFIQLHTPEGVKPSELCKRIVKLGAVDDGKTPEQKLSALMKQMRVFEHANHTWKVSEEGGRYKIFDVKYKKNADKRDAEPTAKKADKQVEKPAKKEKASKKAAEEEDDDDE